MILNHSKICINPPKGIELGGFGYYIERRNEGIMDDIYVRALFLKHDNLSYLIISCDLVGLLPTIVEQVKKRISGITSIPMDAILILCTHTHTSPACTFTIGCGEVDPGYVDMLIEKMVKAGTAAVDGGKEVKRVWWVKQPVEPIGYNRAIPDGPVDNNLYSLVFELDGSRPFVFASYSCHPVTLGPSKYVSADFPGAFISFLNDKGYDGMFANGFSGDIDPVSNSVAWGSGTRDTINNYGRILADGLDEGLKNAMCFEPSIIYNDFTVDLYLQCFSKEELDEIASQSSVIYPEDPVMVRVVNEWVRLIKDKMSSGTELCTEPLYVQVLKIGPVVISALQGEIYTQVGLNIRQLTGDIPLMLLSNANSSTRYIATDDEIINGTYGGFSSCYADGRLPLRTGNFELVVNIVSQFICDIINMKEKELYKRERLPLHKVGG